MRTIESDRAIVDIVAWPEDRPWTGRYQTSSQIDGGTCTLTLSPAVFHDAAKANTAYRRFAQKIRKEGMEPPNVVFRTMLSRASRNGEWAGIKRVIDGMSLNLPNYTEEAAAIEEMLSTGHYAVHHSERYNNHYAPHYRIMAKDIFKAEILPLIKE